MCWLPWLYLVVLSGWSTIDLVLRSFSSLPSPFHFQLSPFNCNARERGSEHVLHNTLPGHAAAQHPAKQALRPQYKSRGWTRHIFLERTPLVKPTVESTLRLEESCRLVFFPEFFSAGHDLVCRGWRERDRQRERERDHGIS